MRKRTLACIAALATLTVLLGLAGAASASSQSARPGFISATTIPSAALIQPRQLDSMLREKSAARPLILQVGSRLMFDAAHIPGSEYAGPGSQPSGLDLLRSRVANLDRAAPIVIYCGCCPWAHCPNMGPAYALLRKMGFTQVKALYIADNFGTDWVNKGYPVANSR